jgi:hypothetical protein
MKGCNRQRNRGMQPCATALQLPVQLWGNRPRNRQLQPCNRPPIGAVQQLHGRIRLLGCPLIVDLLLNLESGSDAP